MIHFTRSKLKHIPLRSVLNIFIAVAVFCILSFYITNIQQSSEKSDATTLYPICIIPHLPIIDLTILKFMKTYPSLLCTADANWVYTENGSIIINATVAAKYGSVSCNYTIIERQTDDTNLYRSPTMLKNETPIPQSQTFRVQCNGGEVKYRNLHIGVPRENLNPKQDSNQISKKNPLKLNVYIYVIDSMSRLGFIRKLPKFYDLLKNKMQAMIFEGFNVVGDGTPWTMIPLTTGHFQSELPEARKRFKNASNVDDWPFIFKNFSDADYITSFAEEQPKYSFYSYKLKGFQQPPVHHYLRTFENEVQNEHNHHNKFCLGDTPRAIILCKWWKEQQKMYNSTNLNTFTIFMASETSHDDYNFVQVLDQHWTDVFSSQWSSGLFNNTILIVMGDHGRRFGSVRQTQSGKTEEKLPFLSFILPEWFKHKYKTAWKNLKENRKRLITPFDIHQTLVSLLNWTEDQNQPMRPLSRGINLFSPIPIDRSCHEAAIKPHFCSCLQWTEVKVDGLIRQIVDHVVVQINNLLVKEVENLCSTLSTQEIKTAKKMVQSKAMLSFMESTDYDNMEAKLTADTKTNYDFYQVKFSTFPNKGQFEVTVMLTINGISFSFDDINRINSYADEAYCVLDHYQHLRMFCHCKQ